MRAIELFAGVGGFRLGLERAGHRVIWANEWDRFACDTYDANFREGRVVRGDIKAVDAAAIPDHDLIVGGFPCQAFSVAGKRRGFDDTRGTLFYEIARIAAHHRTPYLLLENVKGLLNHEQGRTFGTIIEALDDLGYDCQWQVLNSKDFGVPQNRERIIIVANLRGQSRPQVFPLIGADSEDLEAQQDEQPSAQGIATRHLDRNGRLTSRLASTVQVAEVPHIVHQIGKLNEGQSGRVYGTDGISPTLSTMTGGGLKQPKIQAEHRIRRLTPIECERLQAFPDNWTKFGLRPDGTEYAMSDSQRYKQMGNAVTTNVIEAVSRRLPMEA